MKVSNIVNSSGNTVANQFEIHHDGVVLFQSYNSLIAKYKDGVLTLGLDWDYSVTTLRHLYTWLDNNCWRLYNGLEKGKSGRDTIQKAIDKGIIKYDENMY